MGRNIGIAYELIPLKEGGREHIPPVLANHSIEEKAEGLYFYLCKICNKKCEKERNTMWIRKAHENENAPVQCGL